MGQEINKRIRHTKSFIHIKGHFILERTVLILA